jgi:hypothetical protein
MSLSRELVEISRLHAKREFVMPANTGIQVRLLFGFHHFRALNRKRLSALKSRAGA